MTNKTLSKKKSFVGNISKEQAKDAGMAVVLILLLLGIFLILEGLSQPNPGALKTPLYREIGKYSNKRDRFVAGISFAVFLLVLMLASSLLSHNRSIEFIVKVGLSSLLAVGSYYAIRFSFGSQELREDMIPKALRRYLEKRNQSKSD